jgi:hypothetical protein
MGLEQRIKKLESSLNRRQQLVADETEIERTDEEWADWMGDFLWWPKGADMDRRPGYFASDYGHSAGPLGAWQDAARLAWQQGHTDYHVGLRPYALAVWLKWKPSMLEHWRTHGRWIWDVLSRFDGLTKAAYAQLTLEENRQLLWKPSEGHWSK